MKQTPLTCSGHTRPVVDLAFSDITEYGYFLISACKDGKPMLRQGDTGDWIGTFEGHKGAVWGATLSKDGCKAATGAADFSAKVWDAVTGDELKSFSHKHIVKSVDFSADGRKLLTGSNEKKLYVFDLESEGSEPIASFAGHTGSIRRCIFMNNDKQVASVSDDKTIRFWDIETQQQLECVELDDIPFDVQLSKCGTMLTIPKGKDVGFWDVSRRAQVHTLTSEAKINSAALSPDMKTVVCGGDDFKMFKYDYNTCLEIESVKGHFGPIHCTRFSPDGEVYASGSEDGTLRLWQTTVGKTYGLWSCTGPAGDEASETSPQQVATEA